MAGAAAAGFQQGHIARRRLTLRVILPPSLPLRPPSLAACAGGSSLLSPLALHGSRRKLTPARKGYPAPRRLRVCCRICETQHEGRSSAETGCPGGGLSVEAGAMDGGSGRRREAHDAGTAPAIWLLRHLCVREHQGPPEFASETALQRAQRGVPRSGVWSEVETGMSRTSGIAGEETMDGRRAVAERKPPASPVATDSHLHPGSRVHTAGARCNMRHGKVKR